MFNCGLCSAKADSSILTLQHPYPQTASDFAGTAADTVTSAAKSASPFALSALESALAQQPTVLAAGAGGLVLLYLLAPSLVGGIGSAFRGYAGENPQKNVQKTSLNTPSNQVIK